MKDLKDSMQAAHIIIFMSNCLSNTFMRPIFNGQANGRRCYWRRFGGKNSNCNEAINREHGLQQLEIHTRATFLPWLKAYEMGKTHVVERSKVENKLNDLTSLVK